MEKLQLEKYFDKDAINLISKASFVFESLKRNNFFISNFNNHERFTLTLITTMLLFNEIESNSLNSDGFNLEQIANFLNINNIKNITINYDDNINYYKNLNHVHTFNYNLIGIINALNINDRKLNIKDLILGLYERSNLEYTVINSKIHSEDNNHKIIMFPESNLNKFLNTYNYNEIQSNNNVSNTYSDSGSSKVNDTCKVK